MYEFCHCATISLLSTYGYTAQNQASCSKQVISVTEHLVEVVDRLSTTAVVVFRSERILKCKLLYGV